MRTWLAALLTVGMAPSAFAGDFDIPFLRGSEDVFTPAPPPLYRKWSGFYFGVQGGMSNGLVDFGTTAKSMLRDLLATTPLPGQTALANSVSLSRDSRSAGSYGAFGGYNAQWDDVILGVDFNYNRTSIDASSFSQASPTVPNGANTSYTATVSIFSSFHLTDYATIRARAGYLMGPVMVYVAGGLAVGRGDLRNTATVTYTATAITPPGAPVTVGPLVAAAPEDNVWTTGVAAAAGAEFMLTNNIFLRGEYEYVKFTSFGNTGRNMSLNAFRGGAGYRF